MNEYLRAGCPHEDTHIDVYLLTLLLPYASPHCLDCMYEWENQRIRLPRQKALLLYIRLL